MKKVLHILLVACLIITLIPGSAFAKSKYVPKKDVKNWQQIYPTPMSVYGKHDSPYELKIYQKVTKSKTSVCFEVYQNGKIKAHYTTNATKTKKKNSEMNNIKSDPALKGVYEHYRNLYSSENRVGTLEALKVVDSKKAAKLAKENLEYLVNSYLEKNEIDYEADFSEGKTSWELIEEKMSQSAASIDAVNVWEHSFVILNDADKLSSSKTNDFIKNFKALFDGNYIGALLTPVADTINYANEAAEKVRFTKYLTTHVWGDIIGLTDLKMTQPLQSSIQAIDPNAKILPYYNDIDESYDFIVKKILKLSKKKK